MASYGNAALAYDVQAQPAYAPTAPSARPQAPAQERPHFDVYTGAGLDANQAVSPVFVQVIKTFCVLAAIFCIIGVGRVTLASFTAATLNENAVISSSLEEAAADTKELEVMRAVYSSETRIRELAAGYGMAEPASNVTLDFTADAQAVEEAQNTEAQSEVASTYLQ